MGFQLEFIGDEAGYDIKRQIQFCKENKINSIHLRSIGGKLLHEFTVYERKAMVEELKKDRIVVNCILSKIGKHPVLNKEKWIENVKEYILICKEFNCRFLRIFSYGFENTDAVRIIQSFAHDKRVSLVIENEINTPMNSLSQASLLLKKHNYSFSILLDVGNLFIENEDSLEFFKNLKSYISIIHVKELAVDGCGNYIGCELGKGCTNTKQVIGILNNEFSGKIVLEAYHKIQDNKSELKYETLKNIYTSFLKYKINSIYEI